MRKRYKLFCSLSTNVPDPDAWQDMDFKMTRNIPKNVSEEIAAAAQAEGIVSKQTQLGLLSCVPDPVAEMERMQKEREEELQHQEEQAAQMYGFGSQTVTNNGEEV